MGAGIELWLVRHGETEWSKSGAHTGCTDIPLTDKGREQASRVGNYLTGTKFDAVLVSPLSRARETCKLAGFGEEAVVEPNLTEWNYGIYEGKTTAQIREGIPGWTVWKNLVPEGEAVEAVGLRADAVIAHAMTIRGLEGKVALFAHAHILRILAARWINLEATAGQLFTLATGSLSILDWEREARVVSTWNHEFPE